MVLVAECDALLASEIMGVFTLGIAAPFPAYQGLKRLLIDGAGFLELKPSLGFVYVATVTGGTYAQEWLDAGCGAVRG